MKKEIKYFTSFDVEEEEAYLASMHRSGWKLVKISYFPLVLFPTFHFEETCPAEVVYGVDYRIDRRKKQHKKSKSNCTKI